MVATTPEVITFTLKGNEDPNNPAHFQKTQNAENPRLMPIGGFVLIKEDIEPGKKPLNHTLARFVDSATQQQPVRPVG